MAEKRITKLPPLSLASPFYSHNGKTEGHLFPMFPNMSLLHTRYISLLCAANHNSFACEMETINSNRAIVKALRLIARIHCHMNFTIPRENKNGLNGVKNKQDAVFSKHNKKVTTKGRV